MPIQKQLNLQKNSFTLFETLVSLTIIIVVIALFQKITQRDLKEDEFFHLLNILENNFDTKNYSNLQKTSKNITITKNQNIVETLNVNLYKYEDENIRLFKYEK